MAADAGAKARRTQIQARVRAEPCPWAHEGPGWEAEVKGSHCSLVGLKQAGTLREGTRCRKPQKKRNKKQREEASCGWKRGLKRLKAVKWRQEQKPAAWGLSTL